MQVRVRHFAVLRERRGCSEEWVECERPTTAAALFERLFGEPLPRSVGVAVNRAYGAAATALRDQDEVVFVPPVGGG